MSGDSFRSDDDDGVRAILQALRSPLDSRAVLAVVVATEELDLSKTRRADLLPRSAPRRLAIEAAALEADWNTRRTAWQAGGRRCISATRARRRRSRLRLGLGLPRRRRTPAAAHRRSAPLLAALRRLDTAAALQLELQADGRRRSRWRSAGNGRHPRHRRQHAGRADRGTAPAAARRRSRIAAAAAARASARLARRRRRIRARWFDALATADAQHADLTALAQRTALSPYTAAVVVSHHYSRDGDFLAYSRPARFRG